MVINEAPHAKILGNVGHGPGHHCVAPRLWEGKVMWYGRSKQISILAKISYDSRNRRIRRVEEVFHNETEDLYDILELFGSEKTVRYVLNMGTKKCSQHITHDRFRPIEPPANTTFRRQFYIGAPGLPEDGLLADVYAGEVDGGHYMGTFTHLKCVPISFGYKRQDVGYMHGDFYNIVLGIENPNVFEVPKE